MTEFKVGDIVEAFGCRGVVVNSEDQLTFVKYVLGMSVLPTIFIRTVNRRRGIKNPLLN